MDDEQWNAFVGEFEKGRGLPRPSAAEPEAAARRPRRRTFAAVTVVAVAAVAGAGFWLGAGHGTRHEQAAGEAPGHASTAPSQRPTEPAEPKSSVEPSTAATSMVTAHQAFPAQVAGYTKVMQTGGPNCTGGIGSNLAAEIDKSKGCRGVIGALYKDASDDRYTIVAFGMKDQLDAIHLVTFLASHPTDYEVPVLTPPAGSGLKALLADSGLVQSFAGRSRLMVVGMAQWSDGRTADFQDLAPKLQPLMDRVSKGAGARDQG